MVKNIKKKIREHNAERILGHQHRTQLSVGYEDTVHEHKVI